MSRADLGFVVSRALAVLIGIQGLRQVEALLGPLQSLVRNGGRDISWMWPSFASLGATFGLVLLLWANAPRFGGIETGEGNRLTREGLAQVLIAAMGIWMVGSALGDVITGIIWQIIVPDKVEGPIWITPIVRGAIGSILFIVGDGMGLLRAILPRRPLYDDE
ncbi:MAG: hypothetical protein ACO1SV_00485 [Fimbriimonas sp.]